MRVTRYEANLGTFDARELASVFEDAAFAESINHFIIHPFHQILISSIIHFPLSLFPKQIQIPPKHKNAIPLETSLLLQNVEIHKVFDDCIRRRLTHL